jgi:hypothetical protein
MPGTRRCLAVLILLLATPAYAQTPDALQGKFAFNWYNNPDREKCVRVTARRFQVQDLSLRSERQNEYLEWREGEHMHSDQRP